MFDTLNGIVELVTFRKSDNGLAVPRGKVPRREDVVSLNGSAASATAGEHFEALERCNIDREHGRQFKDNSLRTACPVSTEAIEPIPGAVGSIGTKIAARTVAAFGKRTLRIFDDFPEYLVHVKGDGKPRLRRIRQSCQEH